MTSYAPTQDYLHTFKQSFHPLGVKCTIGSSPFCPIIFFLKDKVRNIYAENMIFCQYFLYTFTIFFRLFERKKILKILASIFRIIFLWPYWPYNHGIYLFFEILRIAPSEVLTVALLFKSVYAMEMGCTN